MNKQKGFVKLIIVIIIALLLMKYFNITFSDILKYFGVTVTDLINWVKQGLNWFKDLFTSVAK